MRRAQSADRLTGDALDRLATQLHNLATTHRPPVPAPVQRDRFKTPTYNGVGDVDYFLRKFQDVSNASNWEPDEALIHLRDALQGEAEDCGRGQTMWAITESLRARFGLSSREARYRLSSLKKNAKMGVHAYAIEVEKLIEIGHNNLPAALRREMALEKFLTTLGHTALQRHLLAVHPTTMEEAVNSSHEFLQIQTTFLPGSSIHSVDTNEAEEAPAKAKVSLVQDDALKSLAESLSKLTNEVALLKASRPTPLPERYPLTQSRQPRQPRQPRPPSHSGTRCWECQGMGHTRRECPCNAWNQGNDLSPQQ